MTMRSHSERMRIAEWIRATLDESEKFRRIVADRDGASYASAAQLGWLQGSLEVLAINMEFGIDLPSVTMADDSRV